MQNRTASPYITCVVPAFNEAENIAEFTRVLHEQLQALTEKFEIIVVDDCSTDDTVAVTLGVAEQYSVKLIEFSRNFGKENALSAGIDHAAGDVVVLIDADFQHPVELIPELLARWRQGYDMVYAAQVDRDYMSTLRRVSTRSFYYLMSKLAKIRILEEAGDFRLMDRKVIEALKAMPERGRFMKGLYSWVGFKTIGVPYTVRQREAGTSQFNFRSLSALALTGILSFSETPLRVWGFLGFIVAFASLIYAGLIVANTLIFGVDVPGWATLVVAITFLGGLQLLSIGVLGEYIGRIFNEVKQRPPYLVSRKYRFEEEADTDEQ